MPEEHNNMSQTVTTQAAAIMASAFGVIDPAMGHMIDPDNTVIHRAIVSQMLYFTAFNLLLFESCDCEILHMMWKTVMTHYMIMGH